MTATTETKIAYAKIDFRAFRAALDKTDALMGVEARTDKDAIRACMGGLLEAGALIEQHIWTLGAPEWAKAKAAWEGINSTIDKIRQDIQAYIKQGTVTREQLSNKLYYCVFGAAKLTAQCEAQMIADQAA